MLVLCICIGVQIQKGNVYCSQISSAATKIFRFLRQVTGKFIGHFALFSIKLALNHRLKSHGKSVCLFQRNMLHSIPIRTFQLENKLLVN